jgi:hypothetical protein
LASAAQRENSGSPAAPRELQRRTGAATNIATEAVVRSPPDGYTLLAAVSTMVRRIEPYIALPVLRQTILALGEEFLRLHRLLRLPAAGRIKIDLAHDLPGSVNVSLRRIPAYSGV